jgi:2-dehydro-3-deoxygluconokinase
MPTSEPSNSAPVFVALGEVMVRDMPADMERPERTRLVHLSMAGSEYSLAIGLSRLGIPSAYVTRVPDSAYGWAVRNIAREHGVRTDWFVWAAPTEPIGRYIYELGRTPRPGVGTYQRMFSAASRLDAGMVDWAAALSNARLFHTSGITFGLAAHSRYERNYLHDAFLEALAARPPACLVGLDFNYRSTLWPDGVDQARAVLDPVLTAHVDILITSPHDMALFYGVGCGRFSAEQVLAGEAARLEDEDLLAFGREVQRRFQVHVVAVTQRYADSFEHHRWESAAVGMDGVLVRSAAIRDMHVLDTLGGGDAWLAGFYFGLLTAGQGPERSEGLGQDGLAQGIRVGDAATRLQQTLMFDLPVIDWAEVQALLAADESGARARSVRR